MLREAEEMGRGNLLASPAGAALGDSETPGCHLISPLLVNRRGVSTGNRTPVSPSRTEVTCWKWLPGPTAGLSALPGCPDPLPTLHPSLSPPRRSSHLSSSCCRFPSQSPRTQRFVIAARVFALSPLIPSFSVIISWVLSPP